MHRGEFKVITFVDQWSLAGGNRGHAFRSRVAAEQARVKNLF
jgi:hypothetical protein